MKDKDAIPALLIDSDCTVCNSLVNFLRRHLEKYEEIEFDSLYSDEGKSLLKKYNFPEDYNKSLVYIDRKKAFIKSDAVLQLVKKMKGLYPALAVFKFTPKKIRDFFYDLVAKHRHDL